MPRALAPVIVLLLTTLAHADPSDGTKLFEEGRALMDQGKVQAACDKFRKSIEIEPAIGTQLNLGVCLQKLGHNAEAWRLFDRAADAERTSNPERSKFARDLADKVLPRLGTIVLTIAEPDAPGLEVTIAGRVVKPAEVVKERVDPGDIKVTRTQQEGAPYERTLHVDAGGTAEITVPAPPASGGSGTGEETGHKVRRHSRVVLAYGVAGAGVVALGAGIAIGLKARSDYNANVGAGKCDGSPLDCHGNDQYYQGAKDARSLATIGTVVGVAGVALVGAGAVLWLTAPKDVVVAPTATGESAGISVVGRF
jgi:tetratricopeptide (TPR) repeat protein